MQIVKTTMFLILFSTFVLGQEVTRGPVTNVITYTTAPVALFVDPTGSDTNACTASGSNACLTIQGAFGKVPKGLRHQVTVTAAPGTYAGATISGFTVDPSFQKTTAGILLDGALANVTPTTGSAIGTATGGTAGGGVTGGTLVDSGATWTVNDSAIVGKFAVILTGTGAGQIRPIVSNTATSVTVVGSWTAPTAGSTYAIQSPSVIINSTTAAIPTNGGGTIVFAAGLQIVDNVTNSTQIVVRNVAVNIAGSDSSDVANTGPVLFTQVLTSSTTSASLRVFLGSTFNCTSCSVTTTTGSGVSTTSATTTLTNTRIQTAALDGTFTTSGGIFTASTCQINGVNAIVIQNGSTGAVSNTRCDCASAANSACLVAGIEAASVGTQAGSGRASSIRMSAGVDVANCTYGALASGGVANISATSTSPLTGNALTYGANSLQGASITMQTNTNTLTAGTAEMAVDNGASTGTWASLAASYSCLINLTTTSRICRQ